MQQQTRKCASSAGFPAEEAPAYTEMSPPPTTSGRLHGKWIKPDGLTLHIEENSRWSSDHPNAGASEPQTYTTSIDGSTITIDWPKWGKAELTHDPANDWLLEYNLDDGGTSSWSRRTVEKSPKNSSDEARSESAHGQHSSVDTP